MLKVLEGMYSVVINQGLLKRTNAMPILVLAGVSMNME